MSNQIHSYSRETWSFVIYKYKEFIKWEISFYVRVSGMIKDYIIVVSTPFIFTFILILNIKQPVKADFHSPTYEHDLID